MWLYRCRVLILSPVDRKITNLTPFAANSNWFIILKLGYQLIQLFGILHKSFNFSFDFFRFPKRILFYALISRKQKTLSSGNEQSPAASSSEDK